MASTCVIITNYLTGNLAVECLRSLATEAAALPGLRAIVVDNCSPNDSVARISAAIEAEGWTWASVRALAHNGGFAFGNNAGIREAMQWREPPRYILLLNPDTLVRPGALRALSEFMDQHPEVGIAGARLEDPDGTPHCSAHRFPTPLSELDSGAKLGLLRRFLNRYVVCPPIQDQAHPCEWVSGAAMLIRREVIEKIGLMDDRYFLYFEEVDYCVQAIRAGFSIWHVPQSRIVHLEGQSTGISDIGRRRGEYWYDSRRRFFVRAYGVLGWLAADALWAMGRLSLGMRRILGLCRTAPTDPPRFALDLLWGDAKALMTGRALRIDRGGIRS